MGCLLWQLHAIIYCKTVSTTPWPLHFFWSHHPHQLSTNWMSKNFSFGSRAPWSAAFLSLFQTPLDSLVMEMMSRCFRPVCVSNLPTIKCVDLSFQNSPASKLTDVLNHFFPQNTLDCIMLIITELGILGNTAQCTVFRGHEEDFDKLKTLSPYYINMLFFF